MTDYKSLIEQSKEIALKAIEQYKPYAIVAAVSGGNDSMTSYQVMKHAGIKIDGILHVNTQTGIEDTTQFVRAFAEREQVRYFEGDAGDTYETHVMRKGFPGRGLSAHALIYHVLKASNLRKLISAHFRQGRRGRNVLIFNGVLKGESANRAINYGDSYYNADPGAGSNIWVNHIWEHSKQDCKLIRETVSAPINSVTELLHRSAECMCGATQSEEDRRMASFFFPAWEKKLYALEQRVTCVHPWKWGENPPAWWTQVKRGQMTMGKEFMPMCTGCQLLPQPEAA